MPTAAELLREGIWDSLLHPRAQAGSTAGGQFTSGGSGGGRSKGGHAVHVAKASNGGGGAKKAKAPAKLLAYDPKTNTGPGYNLPHGDPRVHQLQEALNRLGAADGHGRQLVDDGKLGPLTTEAVKNAQTKLGLKATGRVTPALLTRLLAAKTLTPARRARKAVPVKVTQHPLRRAHQSMTAADLLFGRPGVVAAREAWDELLHPRGPGGRFAKLGDEEREARRKARNEARRGARAAAKTGGKAASAAKTAGAKVVEKPHTHDSILAHASTMSDEDLGKLHEAIAAMHHDRQAKAAVSAHPGKHPGKSVEERIVAAHRDLYKGKPQPGNQWVGLADIREHPQLAGVPRSEVDEALLRMERAERMTQDVRLVPTANRKALSARDHAAALVLGGDEINAMHVSDHYRPATQEPARPPARIPRR